MRCRTFGKTGMEVSEIGLGTSKGLSAERCAMIRECYRKAVAEVG